MEDALVNFVTKGKMDFSSFVDSVIADLARAQIRQSITGPLASAFGGFDFGKILGFGNHTGGIAGAEATFARAVPSGLYTHAPRYHGGGIASDEIPAILKRGEGVFTPEQMKRLAPVEASGPRDMEVRIVNESGTPMQITSTHIDFNDTRRREVMTIVIDSLRNNYMGFRDAVATGG